MEWDSARIIWKNRAAETVQQVYATSTRETENAKNGHSHSTHMPKLTNIYDNLAANIQFAVKPTEQHFSFTANDDESSSKDKAEAVEGYLLTKHRVNGWDEEHEKLINDYLLYGNCFSAVTYENQFTEHPDGELINGYIGPKIQRISPYDIVFNPLATSFEESPKIVRSLVTLGELHRMAEENPELGYNKEIIDLIGAERRAIQNEYETQTQRNKQLTEDGFGTEYQYYRTGVVEVLEFYGDLYDIHENKFFKNHVLTVVDRRHMLRMEPLGTWTGRPHIYHAGWRFRPDNLWAMGPLDNLVGMQYYINHLENARADAFDMMLFPDKVFVTTPEVEENEDGSVNYYFDEGGGVQDMRPDTTVLNADFQIQQKMNDMEMFAGAPREAMGVRTPGEKTAAEFQGLTNAASRFFENKAKDYERFIEKLLNAEWEVARRNLNTTDVIQVLDDDFGVEQFLSVTKEDITASGKITPKGVSHFSRLNQIFSNLQMFEQALATDPEMREHFPSTIKAQLYEEILGFDKFNLYEKWGRIPERAEGQQLNQVAADQTALQAQAPTTGVEGEL